MLDLSNRMSGEFGMPVDVRILNFAPVTFSYHVIQGDLLVDNFERFAAFFSNHCFPCIISTFFMRPKDQADQID